jgi:excisionase family DNA binding protein
MSVRAAADDSSLSISYLYEAMAAGQLPYIKVGARRLIMRDDLVAWLRSHTQTSPAAGDAA